MPEHYVQRFLDHASLSTTSRYLTTTRRGMHQVFRQYEERRDRCKNVARTEDSGVSWTLVSDTDGPAKSLQ